MTDLKKHTPKAKQSEISQSKVSQSEAGQPEEIQPKELQSEKKHQEDALDRLANITEELTRTMEKTRIAEYVDYLEHPFRLMWTNFLIGIARGLGSTIGLAIVLGILIFVVQELILLNLPVISDFIADFILMIQENYTMLK